MEGVREEKWKCYDVPAAITRVKRPLFLTEKSSSRTPHSWPCTVGRDGGWIVEGTADVMFRLRLERMSGAG